MRRRERSNVGGLSASSERIVPSRLEIGDSLSYGVVSGSELIASEPANTGFAGFASVRRYERERSARFERTESGEIEIASFRIGLCQTAWAYNKF